MKDLQTIPAGLLAGGLALLWLCAACGSSTDAVSPAATPPGSGSKPEQVQCFGLGKPPNAEELCQTLSPEQAAAWAEQIAASYPVCGVGLGPPYKGLGVIGPLSRFLGYDATQKAPDPAPIEYAARGVFVLKVAPGCDDGTEVRIEPPSAAEITERAPAADGLPAGVGIQAHAREFRIVGSGAATFTQHVDLACPVDPSPCPKDPRNDGAVVPPEPYPTPWDPKVS